MTVSWWHWHKTWLGGLVTAEGKESEKAFRIGRSPESPLRTYRRNRREAS